MNTRLKESTIVANSMLLRKDISNNFRCVRFGLSSFANKKSLKIRKSKSKKNRQHNGQRKKYRQHNGQRKKYKRTNNDLQNIHIKHEPH